MTSNGKVLKTIPPEPTICSPLPKGNPMNGDSTKQPIAVAQNYFAIQTRRQELDDVQKRIEKRVELRKRVSNANKALNAAAKKAGVQNYGLFHDAGYRGLYGGIGLSEIK